VKGHAPAGSRVSADGHPLQVAPDGSFSEYLRRPAGSSLLIRATLPDGSETEQRRPIAEGPGGD
jgi:hypothetical protein